MIPMHMIRRYGSNRMIYAFRMVRLFLSLLSLTGSLPLQVQQTLPISVSASAVVFNTERYPSS